MPFQEKLKAKITRLLHAVRSGVKSWNKWYLADDSDGLQADFPGEKVRFPPTFSDELLKQLISFRPQDFRYQCSRWRSELLSIVICEALNIELHSSTIRRRLPTHGIFWTRAAPTLQIKDPVKEVKLTPIKQILVSCDVENSVCYEDEVDIHLNSQIGAGWGLQVQQHKAGTPGQNNKHFLAEALQSSSGQMTDIDSMSKNTVLLIDLRKALYRRCKSTKTITSIVYNYIIYKSKIAEQWLKNNPKFKLLFFSCQLPVVQQNRAAVAFVA